MNGRDKHYMQITAAHVQLSTAIVSSYSSVEMSSIALIDMRLKDSLLQSIYCTYRPEGHLSHNILQDTKHFQNVMLVGMASEISKNYTYKCACGSLKTQRNQGCQG